MNKKFLMLSTFLYLLSSCASIPDVPILTRIDISRCAYAYTISDKKGIIDDVNLLNGKTCLDYVNEGLIVPVDSWVEMKKFILKKCRESKNRCDGAGDWSAKIEVLK